MKYLILGIAALLAGQCALAQTNTPAEPAKKDVVPQPAPVKGAAAAKSVGTKDMTDKADAYTKAQEKKRAAMAKKYAAKGGEPKKAAKDAGVRPGSMMTEDERAAHRKNMRSFKTLAECETYEKQHQAEMKARAKAQNKTLAASSGAACNRYKVAADKAAPK